MSFAISIVVILMAWKITRLRDFMDEHLFLKESSSNLTEEAEDEVGEEKETVQEKSSGRHTRREPPASPTNFWGWLRTRRKKKSGNGEVASGEV
jgi:hypothetical protein